MKVKLTCSIIQPSMGQYELPPKNAQFTVFTVPCFDSPSWMTHGYQLMKKTHQLSLYCNIFQHLSTSVNCHCATTRRLNPPATTEGSPVAPLLPGQAGAVRRRPPVDPQDAEALRRRVKALQKKLREIEKLKAALAAALVTGLLVVAQGQGAACRGWELYRW